MRITQYSDYALRTLIYLAVVPKQHELSNIQAIADSYQISKNHLTKIVHHLSKIGLIESVRGKNGGIRLAFAPKDINIGTVLRHTEVDFGMVDCFFGNHLSKKDDGVTDDRGNSADMTIHAEQIGVVNFSQVSKEIPIAPHHWIEKKEQLPVYSSCVISPVCQLKPILFEAIEAFLTVFDRYSLADLVSNPEEIRALLS